MATGIQVRLIPVGSREIATSDLDGYDFVFQQRGWDDRWRETGSGTGGRRRGDLLGR